MRKINFTVTFPISLSLDVDDNATDKEILLKILKSSMELDPSEHDGMVIQEVLDSKEHNNNIVHRIIDLQEELESEESYYNFLAEEEDRKNNEYYYGQRIDEVDNLF